MCTTTNGAYELGCYTRFIYSKIRHHSDHIRINHQSFY